MTRLTFSSFFLLMACFASALIFTSCDDEDDESSPEPSNCSSQATTDSTIYLLSTGDSRIEGARPAYESYRYELWKRMVEAGYNVDFIGQKSDEASYEPVNGFCFDPNHQGTGGFTSTELLQELNGVSYTNPPAVVTLGIGGNDLFTQEDPNLVPPVSDVIANVSAIIDRLRVLNPSVDIFLEQIAPGKTSFMTTEKNNLFTEYYQAIDTLATGKTTATSSIIVIDMAAGFSDDLLADDVHYNEAGAAFIAQRYFDAIKQEVE